jgi:hypothetical protein
VRQPQDQGPVSIAPPKPVAAAGVLACAEALGVVVLTAFILISGFRRSAAVGQLLAQGAYFLIVAAALAGCGLALLNGRRWGRTPIIVVQLIIAAVGYWLAIPSGRTGWGITLLVIAVLTGGLLLSKPASDWISRFPALFGPEPGR